LWVDLIVSEVEPELVRDEVVDFLELEVVLSVIEQCETEGDSLSPIESEVQESPFSLIAAVW
jgi:hypothetical protein